MDEYILEKHFKKGENLVEYFKREQDPADPDKYNLVSRIIDDEKGTITVKMGSCRAGLYKVKIIDTDNIIIIFSDDVFRQQRHLTSSSRQINNIGRNSHPGDSTSQILHYVKTGIDGCPEMVSTAGQISLVEIIGLNPDGKKRPEKS